MPETHDGHTARAGMAQFVETLVAAAGDHLLEAVAAADMDEIALYPGGLLPVVDRLRAQGFNHLLDIGGVDHHPLRPRFEIAYHFTAIPLDDVRADWRRSAAASGMKDLARLRLRVFTDDDDPVVPTLSHLWPSANWPEREIFDLFGVRFEGHPDLRRLLNPDDWKGHPLRKDYPLRGLERRFTPGGRLGAVPPLNES
ncbi:MAG: NADH-quinone oxidoreductase subunit C [Candidatus Eremiobacter antarcticus]|nr:NADH-quinone oxidoreductase subunit C [Candidatus Eremiobacteraeota bacterium]MBC5807032.1 NADH-quinone oxidoreductase subunit C [Candidatus Eremiobacteraeota bacterium]